LAVKKVAVTIRDRTNGKIQKFKIPRQKYYPSFVLAKPYFSDWRLFGQNPETDLVLATMGCTHG
jgi:hypothetical protein